MVGFFFIAGCAEVAAAGGGGGGVVGASVGAGVVGAGAVVEVVASCARVAASMRLLFASSAAANSFSVQVLSSRSLALKIALMSK